MQVKELPLTYLSYPDEQSLESQDLELLLKAKSVLEDAYAPYSQFNVACAILLGNGVIVPGTNQENASFPVGLCAERVALSAVDALYPKEKIVSMAITATTAKATIDKPISPCGNCRQAISEAQHKSGNKIRIILQGEVGEVYIFESLEPLLPFSFDSKFL